MDRLKWSTILIIAVSLICLVLFMLPNPPGAYQAPWNTNLLWAPWAEGLKVLATFLAFVVGAWYGFFGNILKSVKTPVLLISFGCLLLTVGVTLELLMRMQGNDASTFSIASVFFALGAVLVALALLTLPNKLGAKMSKSGLIWYLSIIAALVIGTILIFLLARSEYKPEELITCAVYDVMVLLIFVATIRLVFLFSTGRMGRPFRMIAIGGFFIAVYEYFIWMPFVSNISIFHPIQVLWITGFLTTAAGIADCEISEQ